MGINPDEVFEFEFFVLFEHFHFPVDVGVEDFFDIGVVQREVKFAVRIILDSESVPHEEFVVVLVAVVDGQLLSRLNLLNRFERQKSLPSVCQKHSFEFTIRLERVF